MARFVPILFVLFFLFSGAAAAAAPPAFAVTEGLVCDGAAPGGEREDFDETGCETRGLEDVDPQGRLLWFRTRVAFGADDDLLSEPLAFFSGALASREIWWNGERIGAVGTPGANRAEERAGTIDGVTYIPPRLLRQGENLLAVRMSSFDAPLRVRGPMHFFYVAPYYPLTAAIFLAYAPAMLTAGALIAAAIYFGVGFARDRRDLGALFVAMMSAFAVLQLGTESLRGLVDYPYPYQIWRLIAVALFAFGFGMSMTAYVARRFAPEAWRRYVAVAAVGALLVAPWTPGFDYKALAGLLIPALVALVAAARAAKAARPGAVVAALALAVFAGLIVAQNSRFLDRTFYFAAGGLALVFFLDQQNAFRRARAAEAEARARAARLELELLKRRIAPHFLMNTLNALSEWVESDPKTGVAMIEALAGEFRILSQASGRAFIPLAEEIALCRRHLEVMSYRVDRAFSLRTESVDERLDVPPGVLHTLVENAFTHGRFADGAEFVLKGECGGAGARLVLLSPAPAAGAGPRAEGGEGLSYVIGRLAAAFGPAASVESGPAEGGGWRTVLSWPLPATARP